MERAFVLGIDQGSTHTRAAVCDVAGNVLAVGRAPGACHAFHGMDEAMLAVQAAAGLALAQADVPREAIGVLFVGMTGADWSDEYGLLEANLLSLGLCEHVHVVNDAIVALRGGTSAGYGAILIAGTGANCAILSPTGEQYIYHYYVEADLQGGTGLGRRSLQAIYRAETGREAETVLTARVLTMFDHATVDDLLRADVEGRLPKDAVKDVAPLVFQAALEGDLVAGRILRSFGEGLAELVTAGLHRFGMADLDVEVVVSGSVFKGAGLVEIVTEAIHREAHRARIVNARYEPVVGALLLGLETLGIDVRRDVARSIETSSEALGLVRVPS